MKDPRLPEDFFDYNEITDEHREAAEEILKYLDERDGVPYHLSNRLRVKFGLKEAEKHDSKKSKFYQLAQQYGIYCVENGSMTDEDGSLVPMMRIESDIHRLDEFLEFSRVVLNQEESEKEIQEESEKEIQEDLE